MVQPATVNEPLKLKPILQPRIWGGEGLFRRFGKGEAGQAGIGESWELSDREGSANVVAEGLFAGHDLRDLFSRHAQDILGEQYLPSLSHFPLLYKFIDAREALSVQVHPGEGSPLGEAKSECWYILEAPPEAHLILGLKPGGTRAETLRALAGKDCLAVLNRVPVAAGDLLLIPAGTVHAITAGLLLYEVQQNSDTTFRLYDWDRKDPHGKPRPLHVDQAAEALDFRSHDRHKIKPLTLQRVGYREEMLVACKHFALTRLADCAREAPVGGVNRFRAVTCMRGEFSLAWEAGSTFLRPGETALVPAACQAPRLAETRPGSEAVLSFIPSLMEEVVRPLLAAGHSHESIQELGGVDGLSLSEI